MPHPQYHRRHPPISRPLRDTSAIWVMRTRDGSPQRSGEDRQNGDDRKLSICQAVNPGELRPARQGEPRYPEGATQKETSSSLNGGGVAFASTRKVSRFLLSLSHLTPFGVSP